MAKSPISSQFDKINPACTHGEFLEEKGPRLYQITCNAVTHRWEEKLALCYLLCWHLPPLKHLWQGHLSHVWPHTDTIPPAMCCRALRKKKFQSYGYFPWPPQLGSRQIGPRTLGPLTVGPCGRNSPTDTFSQNVASFYPIWVYIIQNCWYI